ncbi:unnamed protein product [Eruca vesicaria subsp. sativa]|uniref:Uncharacterized protein n=1 Tax=Eruca vesicaria subsp. sativa TaxID=29727 RepID=A0ABC8KAD3_ERUVS|nr:unnamed protein product [Eruca vesicaria subsp. sativa]
MRCLKLLFYIGEVSSERNCLFTVSQKPKEACGINARDLQRRTVSVREEDNMVITEAKKNMYSPDLKSGWGIHIVQEEKLLAKKDGRES